MEGESMQFENGFLVLDADEIGLLSAVSMKYINPQYPAAEFVGSMAEMKAEAEKYIKQIEFKQYQDKRDALRIEVIRLLIETVDSLAAKGYDAAKAAGTPIQWQ